MAQGVIRDILCDVSRPECCILSNQLDGYDDSCSVPLLRVSDGAVNVYHLHIHDIRVAHPSLLVFRSMCVISTCEVTSSSCLLRADNPQVSLCMWDSSRETSHSDLQEFHRI